MKVEHVQKKALLETVRILRLVLECLKKIGSRLLSTLIELAGVSNKKRSFGFSNVFSLSESF